MSSSTPPTASPKKYTSSIKFSSSKKQSIDEKPIDPIEKLINSTDTSLPLDLFKGKIFITIGFNLKETASLKSLIKKFGGDVAFQPNKNVNYCITLQEEYEKHSLKIQQAIKISSIEILSKDFIIQSITKGSIDVNDNNRLHKPNENSNSGNNSSNKSSPILPNLFKDQADTSQKAKDKKQVNLNQLELILKPKRRLKLFISSTFLDMVKEREYIVTYLVPQLKEYCNSRFIDFTFVDMRWGITNEEMKRKNTIATCLSEVSTSNYFISLLGNRYGWYNGTAYDESYQLATSYFSWLKDQHKNKSITELEILQSLLPLPPNPQQASPQSRHTFFYLKTISKDDNSSEIDNGDDQSKESIEKLTNLKISLLKAGKNLQRYHEINELLSVIYKDLIKQIEIDYPINLDSNCSLYEVDQHISYSQSLLNHYIPNNPLSLTKLNQFVVSSQLRNSIGNTPSQVMIVTSGNGFGKSTFLANWLHKASQSKTILDPKKSLVVMCHIGITPKSKSRWEILKQLFLIIRSHYQINVPISDHDPTSLLEEINYWFDVACRDGRKLVWILDGLENIDKLRPDETIAETLSWLPTKFTSNIKLIISSTSGTPTFDHIKAIYSGGGGSILTIKGFESIDDILQYSTDYLKFYSKELDPVQTELIKQLKTPCESPVFLSTVLSELISVGNFENLNQKLATLLSTQFILALYFTIVQKWESDENYPKQLVQNILSLVYLSEIGLYEHEILEILDLKSSFGFFSSIRSLFNGNNFFTINNTTFKLALKFKFFPKDNDDENVNALKLKSDLVNYFIQSLKKTLSSGTLDSTTASEISRKVEYIPKLLMNINDKTSLKDFLLNFGNLQYLIANESSRRSLIKYWGWLGYTPNEMIKFYQNGYVNYKSNRPPMEEFSLVTFNLGKLFEFLSFYDLAYEFVELSKDYHINLYGELHPKVLLDDQVLALISIKKSKIDTAEYLAEKSISVAEKLYGKDQIGTCESLQLNGLVKKKKTNYKEAKEFYEQAIKIVFRFLGYTETNDVTTNTPTNIVEKSSQSFNSKLADLYNNLGDTYRKLEGQVNFEKALSYYNKTIEIYSNLRDSKHPSFSELYKNLGLVAKKLGNYKDAESHYLLALSIIEINFGKSHVDYGLYLCDLADSKRKEDNYVEAERLYNQALPILLEKLGEMNIEVAEIYNNLGLIRKKLGHYKEAIEFYNKAINIAEETLGKSHQKVSFYNHNLADCYRKLGDYKKAEVLFGKCLIITQDHLGNDHPEVSEILNSLGLVYKKQSKYSFAEREYKRAISIIARAFGQDHYKIGIYTNNLADVYRKMGKNDQAKTLYTKALNVIDKSLGSEHSEYAEVLYGMGLNNIGLEQYDTSISLIERAIAIVKKELGDNIAKIGIYLNSLAEVKIAKLKSTHHQQATLEELDEIRESFEKAYKILVQDLGESHPEIADIWINRAECEFKWGSHQLSKEYFEKSLDIIKVVFDEDHIKFKTISDRIRYF